MRVCRQAMQHRRRPGLQVTPKTHATLRDGLPDCAGAADMEAGLCSREPLVGWKQHKGPMHTARSGLGRGQAG